MKEISKFLILTPLDHKSLNYCFPILSTLLSQEEELKLAEKRTKGYLFSIFLFLGVAIIALLFARINRFETYTSYLNGITIISGGVGLVDIGIYLLSRKLYLDLKHGTKTKEI